MIRKIGLTIALLLVLSLGVWAIVRGNVPQNKAGLQVTASYYPLFDFAKQVGGDLVQATNVTPPGAEPHDFEPSAKALAEAQKSRVFIYNGGSLEPWTEKFRQDYKGTVIKASQGIPLQTGQPEEGQASGNVHDPHFWLDPILAEQIISNVKDGLSQADPAHAAIYARNAATYIRQLQQLDRDYRAGLSQCAQRTVIVSHQSMSYLAARYNLSVEAIAGLSPDSEPNPERLAGISRIVADENIHYIFFESLVSPRLADTIAKETGARTLVFDPIEGLSNEAQKAGKNYLSVQRDNLKNLRLALTCQ